MVLLLDVGGNGADACSVLRNLRDNPKTTHVPVLAFAESEPELEQARLAGATLAVNNAAIHSHLEQLLEQVLRLD